MPLSVKKISTLVELLTPSFAEADSIISDTLKCIHNADYCS